MSAPLYGLVEAGGTKCLVGVATADRKIFAEARVPTSTPRETIGAMLDWFGTQPRPAAIGIASFGPLEIDRASAQWGHIRETTKPYWSGVDMAGPFATHLGCPVAIDTDVNAAALAEWLWGAAQGQRVALYATIGTGIGGGAMIEGKLLHGLTHPEMGHIRVARHLGDLEFPGICPFHGDCLEGLASGPAIQARWGGPLSSFASDHAAHGIIAHYLAQFAVSMQAVFEPGRIILGGGVMETPGMLARVRQTAAELGNGYFRGDPHEIILSPGLRNHAGLFGALALALKLSV